MALPLSVSDLGLSLNDNSENTYIEGLIQAATNIFERSTGYVPMTKTLTLILDHWPSDRKIWIRQQPVTDVASITYLKPDGTTGTVSSNDYIKNLDVNPTPIYLLPTLGSPPLNPYLPQIKVTYKAGHLLAADVPAELKRAITLLVNAWYSVREEFTDEALAPIPMGWHYLANQFKSGVTEVLN